MNEICWKYECIASSMAICTLRVAFWLALLSAMASIDYNLHTVYDFIQRVSRLFGDIADSKLTRGTCYEVTASDFLNHNITLRTFHCLSE